MYKNKSTREENSSKLKIKGSGKLTFVRIRGGNGHPAKVWVSVVVWGLELHVSIFEKIMSTIYVVTSYKYTK